MDAKNLAERYGTPRLEWDTIVTGLDRGLTRAPDGGATRWDLTTAAGGCR